MEILKQPVLKVVMLWVLALFLNCKSAQKNVDRTTPLSIGQVYYTKAVQDNQVLSTDLFIPIISNPNHITLLRVFFQGKQADLERINKNLIVGHFNIEDHNKSDIIMSSDPYAEYGNQVPKLHKPIPFNLKEDECVISYKDDDTVTYFKVGNIIKK